MAAPTQKPARLGLRTVFSLNRPRSTMGSAATASRHMNSARPTAPSAKRMSTCGDAHPHDEAPERAVRIGNRPSAASAAPSRSNGRFGPGGRRCITRTAPISTRAPTTGVNQNTLRHPQMPTSTPAMFSDTTGATVMMAVRIPMARPRWWNRMVA